MKELEVALTPKQFVMLDYISDNKRILNAINLKNEKTNVKEPKLVNENDVAEYIIEDLYTFGNKPYSATKTMKDGIIPRYHESYVKGIRGERHIFEIDNKYYKMFMLIKNDWFKQSTISPDNWKDNTCVFNFILWDAFRCEF